MNMSETILNPTDFHCIDNFVKVIQGQCQEGELLIAACSFLDKENA